MCCIVNADCYPRSPLCLCQTFSGPFYDLVGIHEYRWGCVLEILEIFLIKRGAVCATEAAHSRLYFTEHH